MVIGEKVSHYKIIDKLGSGGMGEVYKAEDIKLKRTVALKFLPSSFSFDKEAKKRFTNEAQSASALDHPNICTIHEIGETVNGQLFISMACYEGETLKEKIEKEVLNIDEAIDITLQICEGLKKAHQNKITHRDIKPANIFITKDGVVKILDFGLAKVKGQSQLTQIGTTIGTIDYMSPEQTRGEEVDQRTDIWSLGVVIYEMITGKLPFKGEYDQAIIYSILNEDPDLSDIPNEIYPVIKKAIDKSPKERYQNVEEIISDLVSLKGSATKKYRLLVFPHRISSKIKIVLTAVLLITMVAILYFVIKPFNIGTSTPDRKMIVVLPFENLGPPEDEYFAQGMREEISNKLASLGSIGVISRNSAEKFAKSNKTTKEIGKELGVDYILEGTVQWAKNKDKNSRIRIIPQLVRVSDDISVWSDSYDRILNDIFDVQNEIAQNVVDKLGIKILPGQSVTGPPPTRNLDAYDYYLKAHKFHYGPSTGANIKTAIKLYEQAIALDSNFAAAYAQLSIAYNGLFFWHWDRDSLNLKKASIYLQKAKELNPNIAEIHLAQFFYYNWFTTDEEKVFDELKKTLEIQPNNAEANLDISGYYRDKRQFELARRYETKAMQLDPLNARYPWQLGGDYYSLRNYETAEKYFLKAIKLSPNTSGLYVDLALLYIDWKGDLKLAKKTISNVNDDEYLEMSSNIFIYLNILDRKYDKAVEQLKSSKKEYRNIASSYLSNLQMIALVYKYQGKDNLSKKYFDSSLVKIEKLVKTSPDDFRFPLALSISYAGLGEKEKATEELKKGIKLLDWYIDKKWISNKQKLYLAEISILTSDYDTALKQIDFLLSKYLISVDEMKLNPLYDSLRNLPGYETLIEKYSN